MDMFALTGAAIFDGYERHERHALVVKDGHVSAVLAENEVGPDVRTIRLDGGTLAPGFVDVQVNGGGGVLFNEKPTVEGIRAICSAHAKYGSTALLPTVITDRLEVTFAAIAAVEQAIAADVPGCIGIHVEGPFISLARKGAHDPALIRPMQTGDLTRILETKVRPLLLTVAPESVSMEQIARLAQAGILVSLGHTDTDEATAKAAFAAGATGVTHLFNAMNQMTHRAPGLVGAALDTQDVWCGFIPDGHHVHPTALGAALRAKRGPGRMMVVTDAMPTVGSPEDTFVLNGRLARRHAGRLTLGDGTLAGSDLSMIEALRYCVTTLGVGSNEALRMCSLYPAQFLKIDDIVGSLLPGRRADIVWIDERIELRNVWSRGADGKM